MFAGALLLSESSGDERIDEIVRGLIGIYEAVFPGRIRGYFLTGTYATGGLTPLSDLDLLVLFKGAFASAEERATAQRLNGALYAARFAAVRLDIPAWAEAELSPLGRILLKLASRVVYGEDVRESIELPPMDDYIAATLDIACDHLARVLRGPDWREPTVLVYPLGYPDPAAEFFGYAQKRIPFWYPPAVTSGLKELVATVGRLATAIVALRTRRYVPSRQESVALYQALIDGEWADYVAAIYRDAKGRWGYLPPDDLAGRAELRELCRRTLGFENHFLAIVRAHALAQLAQSDRAGRLSAVRRLQGILYRDDEVTASLHTAARCGDPELEREAMEALRRLQQ